MKKAVFLFLCCAMLCSVSSCAQTYESPESIGGHDSDSDQTTSPVENIQTDFSQPDKVYQYFSSCVGENPYDKWLKAELEYERSFLVLSTCKFTTNVLYLIVY